MTKDWKYNITKWGTIIRNRYAVITSNGQINPHPWNIKRNTKCKLVLGNPIKIAFAAAKFKKENQI